MSLDIHSLTRDFGDPEAEADACRAAAALFDFSFIARARVEGPGALATIARLTPRPLADLPPGRIRYALAADAAGRLVSDLTVWRLGPEDFEVMSGRVEDIAALAAAARDCRVLDQSGDTSVLAVQGPRAFAALAPLSDVRLLAALPYYGHAEVEVAGIWTRIGRLGYTGEAGFEIVAGRGARRQIWNALASEARPAGFSAADRLRIEAGFVLFANELMVPVSAAEVGLDRYASPGGRAGAELALVCLGADDREIERPWSPPVPPPRPGRPGEVAITSACRSPLRPGLLLLGFARRADLAAGVPLHDAAGRFQALVRLPLPLYDPGKRRPRAPFAA